MFEIAAAFVTSIFSVFGLFLVTHRKDSALLKEVHEVVTAETSSGAKKVWSPAEPLADLKNAVDKFAERIDPKQIERTHHNTGLIHDQLGEVIHVLLVVKNALENKNAN